MLRGARGPAVLECAMDMGGRRGAGGLQGRVAAREPAVDEDAVAAAAKKLGAAKRPMIVCGGGAPGASAEVTALSRMLQAPVLGYRRGRGGLDSRAPRGGPLPLGRELWGDAHAVRG